MHIFDHTRRAYSEIHARAKVSREPASVIPQFDYTGRIATSGVRDLFL